jgi:hypothetical protein
VFLFLLRTTWPVDISAYPTIMPFLPKRALLASRRSLAFYNDFFVKASLVGISVTQYSELKPCSHGGYILNTNSKGNIMVLNLFIYLRAAFLYYFLICQTRNTFRIYNRTSRRSITVKNKKAMDRWGNFKTHIGGKRKRYVNGLDLLTIESKNKLFGGW